MIERNECRPVRAYLFGPLGSICALKSAQCPPIPVDSFFPVVFIDTLSPCDRIMVDQSDLWTGPVAEYDITAKSISLDCSD